MGQKQQRRQRKFHIGIDLGKSGAIVVQKWHNVFGGETLVDDELITQTYPMPLIGKEIDYLELYKLLEPYEGGNGMVLFEKIVPFGVKTAMFSLGQQSGAVEMACVALSIPFTKIPPQTWQKEMFTGVDQMTRASKTTKSGTSRDTKSMALVAVKRLFPTIKLTFGERARVPDEGLVDALLMSEYAKRKYP